MLKKLIASLLVLSTVSVHAETEELEKYFTIESVDIEMVTETKSGSFTTHMVGGTIPAGNNTPFTIPSAPSFPSGGVAVGLPGDGQDPVARTGQVVKVASDMVGLGEQIYNLVRKGRPVINTQTAAISVMPRQGADGFVDVMDTEGWSMPSSTHIRADYKNGFGGVVVSFEYTIVFSYGGSHDGVGRYITGAQIIPSNVSVSYGFTFDSSMQLMSVANLGSRQNPVASAILNVKYTVGSMFKVIETSDTYQITGKGQLSKL